jgi:hypothetical protein
MSNDEFCDLCRRFPAEAIAQKQFLSELEKLRVGIARVAQQLNFSLAEIPGTPKSWFYGDLAQAALNTERGWNALLARIGEPR